jgi:hypothetical protein
VLRAKHEARREAPGSRLVGPGARVVAIESNAVPRQSASVLSFPLGHSARNEGLQRMCRAPGSDNSC